jgi:hypothetical protein
MVGPLLFIGFLICFYKKVRISTKEKFLICFAAPALIIVLIESLLVRAHANWAAVSLVSLSIFFVNYVYKLDKKIIYLNNYLNLVIGFILFIMIGATLPLSAFDRINGIKDFVIFLEEKNQKNINNIVIADRLLFANLNYSFNSKKIKFYSPLNPGTKITHHFQLKYSLPSTFKQNFILIGSKNEIEYLQSEKNIKLLGAELFSFAEGSIEVYEIIIN